MSDAFFPPHGFLVAYNQLVLEFCYYSTLHLAPARLCIAASALSWGHGLEVIPLLRRGSVDFKKEAKSPCI